MHRGEHHQAGVRDEVRVQKAGAVHQGRARVEEGGGAVDLELEQLRGHLGGPGESARTCCVCVDWAETEKFEYITAS
jgi:hypothetical protein